MIGIRWAELGIARLTAANSKAHRGEEAPRLVRPILGLRKIARTYHCETPRPAVCSRVPRYVMVEAYGYQRKKIALVTGGASGLGAATVRMIVKAGGGAVIIDLNESAGKALAGELGEAVRFVRADVKRSSRSGTSGEDSPLRTFGALHICVNCAGIGDPQKIVGKEGPAASRTLCESRFRVNLIGTFNVARLAAWAISKSQPNADGERGVIVNTASVAAFDRQIGQKPLTPRPRAASLDSPFRWRAIWPAAASA